MLSGSVKDIAITALISPTTLKKLTNKQIPPFTEETKVVNSSHFSFPLFQPLLRWKLQKKIRLRKIYSWKK